MLTRLFHTSENTEDSFTKVSVENTISNLKGLFDIAVPIA